MNIPIIPAHRRRRRHHRRRLGRLVTGIFPDRENAEAAYGAALDRGYSKDDLDLVMCDATREGHFADTAVGKETELGNKAADGAGIGGAIGGAVGAIVAAIAQSA